MPSIRTTIPLRQGGKLLLICLVNVSVAMAIGLAIMNTWQPGLARKAASMPCSNWCREPSPPQPCWPMCA